MQISCVWFGPGTAVAGPYDHQYVWGKVSKLYVTFNGWNDGMELQWYPQCSIKNKPSILGYGSCFMIFASN